MEPALEEAVHRLPKNEALLFTWSCLETAKSLYRALASPSQLAALDSFTGEILRAASGDGSPSPAVLGSLLGELWPDDPDEEEDVELYGPLYCKYSLLRLTRLATWEIAGASCGWAAVVCGCTLLEELRGLQAGIEDTCGSSTDLVSEQNAAFSRIVETLRSPLPLPLKTDHVVSSVEARAARLETALVPRWISAKGWSAEMLAEARNG
ncbi:hypothetical protein J0910_31160 [Nocardiopsis sp. CNT-189]|uniref:hypothetical protein n=1 Tax=Nocardiopsis oceanisediminis TaxID=2816862 RepID=UPI003B37F970